MLRKFLCRLGVHRWVDYFFHRDEWFTGKGVEVVCSCGTSRRFETTKGLGVVRRIIN